MAQTVKMWNPRTGESKNVRSDKTYDKLIDLGWEVLCFPSSDLKYQ